MVSLWRCEICGDSCVGEGAPDRCPFCGAVKKYIKKAAKAKVSFDEKLTDLERENIEKALGIELSNTAFYFCAARKTDDNEGKLLFKALAKIENEHASIFRKLLKMGSAKPANDTCSVSNNDNLNESHSREERAIKFYALAATQSVNPRLKEIFKALVEVETDHLRLSEKRLSSN